MKHIIVEIQKNVAHIILNRPEVHNAFNEEMIEEMIESIQAIQNDDAIQLVVFRSNGKHFCAGADLKWMSKMATYSLEENQKDARRLGELMVQIHELSKPTIVFVHGSAFGGALGIIACCDIAIGADNSRYCLSEVKLGLIPAVISPYVISAIGLRAAKYLFMTAKSINVQRAKHMHLIHEIIPMGDFNNYRNDFIKMILQNSPQAMAQAKQLLLDVEPFKITDELVEMTCNRIADIRASSEGQEGLNAFLEKRKANWIQT